MSTPAPYNNSPAYDDLPAPSQQDELDFVEHVASIHRSQFSPATRYLRSPVAPAEAARLQNFMRFVLSVDYQVDCPTTLTAADRTHFANLHSIIHDNFSTCKDVVKTTADLEAIAPYLWVHLEEPCDILEIPAAQVILFIKRFFRYQTWSRGYYGCITDITRRSFMGFLAAKLVVDREIIIPSVIENKDLRNEFLRAVEQTSNFYFRSLKGIETNVLRATESLPTWKQHLPVVYQVNENPSFELNERGKRIVRYQDCRNQALTNNSAVKLYVWAKSAVGRMLERVDGKDGRTGTGSSTTKHCELF